MLVSISPDLLCCQLPWAGSMNFYRFNFDTRFNMGQTLVLTLLFMSFPLPSVLYKGSKGNMELLSALALTSIIHVLCVHIHVYTRVWYLNISMKLINFSAKRNNFDLKVHQIHDYNLQYLHQHKSHVRHLQCDHHFSQIITKYK